MATSSDPIPAALSIEGLNTPDARASFSLASTCGYRGIGFATNHPELNPESLGPSARRHVKTILAAQHLTVESVRAAAPRAGLADSATIDRTLENARKAMLLARELGVRTVSLNIGKLGDSTGAVGGAGGGSIPEGTIVSALRELAQQADASGLTLALAADGGVESLLRVLKAVDFDRARLELSGGRVIGAGEDALKIAEEAAGGMGMIGQLTASDAIRSGRGGGVRAVPLGEGQLPLRELAEMLREQGFDGPWVVDVRELGDGAAGAEHAAAVLRKLWG